MCMFLLYLYANGTIYVSKLRNFHLIHNFFIYPCEKQFFQYNSFSE